MVNILCNDIYKLFLSGNKANNQKLFDKVFELSRYFFQNPVTVESLENLFELEKKWLCVDLETLEYREAWELRTSLVDARKKRIIDRDLILLLEHPPVFTLGRRGGLDDLTVSPDLLEKSGIPVVQVERGGVITFHGPGQLIMYPIIDLNAARMRVVDYVEKLEEIMIRAVVDSGIIAERNPLNRGIWVGNKKLGSIGIAV